MIFKRVSVLMLACCSLLIISCPSPTSNAPSSPEVTGVSAVSDTSTSTSTTVGSTEADFFKMVGAAIPALEGVSLSSSDSAELTTSAKELVARVAFAGAPLESRNALAAKGLTLGEVSGKMLSVKALSSARDFSAGISVAGSDDLSLGSSSGSTSPTGSYSFSANLTGSNDLTSSQLITLVKFMDDSSGFADGTVLLNGNSATLGLSATASVVIQNASAAEAVGSDEVDVTLNKIALTVNKLEATVSGTNLNYTYYSDSSSTPSTYSGDLTFAAGANINLAFVLSSSSSTLKGGKASITLTFDKSFSTDIDELGALLATLNDDSLSSDEKLPAFENFLLTKGLSTDDVVISVGVWNNGNEQTFSKTYNVASFYEELSAYMSAS